MPRLTPDYPGNRKPPRFAYLRSFLPVLFILLLFSFALSSYSLLSHFRGPAQKQRIGWQSWDVVKVSSGQKSSGNGTAAGNGTIEDFVPSIPLDNWDPLAFHTTGLTEIAVKPCYFPPYLFPSYCAPETTPEIDRDKGQWVIVEKDLNVGTGLWYLNIYYRRSRRLDVPLISDIRVVPEPVPANLTAELEGWIKADGDLHSGTWPSQPETRIWYKTEDQYWDWDDDWWKRDQFAAERQDELSWEYGESITELDVVYGDGDPFYGFERTQGGPISTKTDDKFDSVDLAFRRGTYYPPYAPLPRFHDDGTFKIMQIADLHYSVGAGVCKDTDKSPCIGDPDTASWLGEVLDAEEPDLVVFSGDQLNGQGTSYDSRSVLAKFAKPVIDRGIAWTAVFGNHDSEETDDRAGQMRTMQNMPYNLVLAGPDEVDGVGNYIVKLYSPDASWTHIFTLYFLDSHDRQTSRWPWVEGDYDYIKTSQIDWFLETSASIDPISRPFQPDGGEDLGDIWRRRSQPARLPRQTALAKPNAMMWFHIPLPEAEGVADISGVDGAILEAGSTFDEPGNSKHNSGFFYNGIKEALDAVPIGDDGYYGEAKTAEVKVLSHGHSHNTDRCRRVDGIWMCFDGGSSYSGYGQLGFDRRVRVYQLSDWGEKIETYKHVDSGEVIDRQVLVGEGAAAGAGQDQVDWL